MCEVQAQRETLELFVACTSWSSQVLTGDIQQTTKMEWPH